MVNRRKVNHIATRHFRWRKQLCWLFRGVWKLRAKRIVSSFLPHISEGANILDIGAGSGMLAEEIAKRINVKFTLLDVIDWNVSRFPLMLFDGEHIPFREKQFDIALLIDVVHHSEDEANLVQEALRVAKQVLVVEEVYNHHKINVLATITDNFQYLLYGMPIGTHHRNGDQWFEFFQRYAARV